MEARTNDVIRRFNRAADWLAALVLGAVVSAALMLAVLDQDRHPKAVDLNAKAVQAGGDLLLNANSDTLFKDVGSNGKESTGEITSGKGSVDHVFTETPLQEIPSSPTEPAASTPVVALTPEINRNDAQANPDPGPLADRQDSARAIGPKARNPSNRSSVAFRYVDVKKRLLELWHQSLAKSEKSRSWTVFSNLNKGVRKKAAYTAETSH
jgi:hypothetical protein